MKREQSEAQALQSAEDHSRFGVTAVVWRQYSSGAYFEGTHDDFMEETHMMDELIAGFEDGERTF
ncbi:MAG: hypothetical protein RKO24_12960 [Candidatus Competibacter sp.]|nr:hypothetical protein [Candidatus Sumerlaeaceae bacterium]MDS4070518.1 hypothetical protein [Candidatus Competibacter sp.]